MGSSASIGESASVHNDLVQSLRDGRVWIELSLNTSSDRSFHLVDMICGNPQESVNSTAGKNVLISGCSWDNGEIPKPEDCDRHFNKDGFIAYADEQSIAELIKQIGLNTTYREHFAKPPSIPDGYAFVNVVLQIHSTSGEHFITEVSGCVLKESIQSERDESIEGPLQDPWHIRIEDILPGEKFKNDRAVFSKWWNIVQKQVDHAGQLSSTQDSRNTFFQCVEKQSTALQKMMNQEHDREKYKKYQDEVEMWKDKCRDASTAISNSILNTMFGVGDKLVAQLFSDPAKAALSIEKLKQVKENLASKFEGEIMELANLLEDKEEAAWKALNERYAVQSEAKEQLSTVKALDMFVTNTDRAARSRLSSLLALMKVQESSQQDAAFMHGTRIEFETVLFEIFTTSRLEAFFELGRKRVQARWERAKEEEWNVLQAEQGKMKAKLIEEKISEQEMEAVISQHNDEDARLEGKTNEAIRKHLSKFEENVERSMGLYKAKLDGIRRENELAELSSVGIEKMKAITQIYAILRPKG